jgi:hypothetical protein
MRVCFQCYELVVQSIVLMHVKGACESDGAIPRSKERVACVGVRHFEKIERSSLASRHDR